MEPLIEGSTFEVRSATGMKPLLAAAGDAGSPEKILVAWMSVVHCFHASSRFPILEDEYWHGGLL